MKRKKLTETEIDELVVAEANDMTKWGKPVAVMPNVIRFSTSVIEKAKYLARLHKTRGYQTWLKQVVEERIKLEEELLSDIKRGLKSISNQ